MLHSHFLDKALWLGSWLINWYVPVNYVGNSVALSRCLGEAAEHFGAMPSTRGAVTTSAL
jgi:hypothetical protein